MEVIESLSITEHFKLLNDPRVDRTKMHSLHDILVIAICAVIGGADSWTDVEMFGKSKEEWFRRFLKLPNAIPSHDTFGRVFSMLDPEEFGQCFIRWLTAVAKKLTGKVISVDGKTIRRSFDRASGKGAIHMVSAYASECQLVLGQVKTQAKSNEITAIPELLRMLDISGCIVTIDAMGCQKEIVRKIVNQKGDYVLGLKGNQGTLHKEVSEYFEWAKANQFKDVPHDFYETVEKEHGRIEVRRYFCTNEIEWFEDIGQWFNLRSIIMVEATRTIGDKTSYETRYY